MPVCWNLTYEMIQRAYNLKSLITVVCLTQEIDLSFRPLILTLKDQQLLQEILDLFEIFVRLTCKLQVSSYLTLNYAILLYFSILKKLSTKRQECRGSLIRDAAKAAYHKLNKYYNAS